jgi:hypothetical protein
MHESNSFSSQGTGIALCFLDTTFACRFSFEIENARAGAKLFLEAKALSDILYLRGA